MNYNIFKNELKALLENNPSKEKIFSFIENKKNNFPKYALSFSKATFSLLKDTYTEIALVIIEPELENINDPKFLKIVQKRYQKIDKSKISKEIQERYKTFNKKLLVKNALETFNENLEKEDIDYAIEELKPFVAKYYYLERTILKNIHTRIRYDHPDIAKMVARRIVEKFNDNMYKNMC